MARIYSIVGVRSTITSVLLSAIEFPAPGPARLTRVFVRIGAPNSAGNALFDVKLNGVTIFASPADRPKILAGQTTGFVDIPGIELVENDMISVDVVAPPPGGIAGLYLIVQIDDSPTATQYIKNIYKVALGRDPDGTELAAALIALEAGCAGDFMLIATQILLDVVFDDADYIALARTNSEYVEDLYRAVLGRPSDLGGHTYWVGRLVDSVTREAVRDAFNQSNEHVTNRVVGFCPNTLPGSNAIRIVGIPVDDTDPEIDQVLLFDGTSWGPASLITIPPRTQTVKTTGSLSTGGEETGFIVMGKSGTLIKIAADRACRVRLYSTDAARIADQTRAQGAGRLSAQDGLLLEAIFSAVFLSTFTQDPVLQYYNGDSPVVDKIYYTIANNSGSSHTVAITFDHVTHES